MENSEIEYWLTVEPFVFVGLTEQNALLYNTLDGETIESDNSKVIELLHRLFLKESSGVVLLKMEEYRDEDINSFIKLIRKKYMGDIFNKKYSSGKPIQLFPYFNYHDRKKLYKKINFFPYDDVLKNLFEISIHFGSETKVSELTEFLQSMPCSIKYHIIGNYIQVEDIEILLVFLNQKDVFKYLRNSYTEITNLPENINNKFSYIISVDFPINRQMLIHSFQLLNSKDIPFEYVFNVSSISDSLESEDVIESLKISNYRINPVYTGDNIDFFKKYVFLTKEDILSNSISIKDIFIHQSMNVYDYGKINILPNGDVYANMNNPVLGNISTHSIVDILHKELAEGKSWFRLRDQYPCSNCVYQWLCPSPSDLEVAVGIPNLCHIK